mmetsp:Transcript_29358/g.75096  ORF Transcript_29358/g.75096 Transcript_29358/m.75096 type:complete len:541 (+) Transcript_29358:29-1651(+)
MAPTRQQLNVLSMHELRAMLKSRGLRVTGRKCDLIERLLSSDSAAGATQAGPARSNGAGPVPMPVLMFQPNGTRAPVPPGQSCAAGTAGNAQGPVSAPVRYRPAAGAHGATSQNGATRPLRVPFKATNSGNGASESSGSQQAQGVPHAPPSLRPPSAKRTKTVAHPCRGCAGALQSEDWLDHARWGGPILGCKPPQQGVVCPMCRLLDMDPFLETSRTCLLRVVHVSKYQFSLDVDCTSLQAWRREGFGIWLRGIFARERGCTWPHLLKVEINGAEQIVVERPNPDWKRRDEPISMTPYLKSTVNRITFTLEMAADRQLDEFVLALVRARPRSVADLMSPFRADTSRCCPTEAAKQRVVDILAAHSGDDDINCLVPRTMRLLCPVSHLRMNIPVRGQRCPHLQTFDLEAYMHANGTGNFNKRWRCPVCDIEAQPKTLVVDMYVCEILKQAPMDCEEVCVGDDGSWTAEEPKPELSDDDDFFQRPVETVMLDSPARDVRDLDDTEMGWGGLGNGNPTSEGDPQVRVERVEVQSLLSSDEEN